MAAPQPVQTFENHVRQDPVVTSVLVLYLATLITGIVAIVMSNAAVAGGAAAISGLAGAFGAVMARRYAVKVQDRVIRLEMKLRMREVLPDDLKARINEFALNQLISLRFAPDAELPELARKVLNEKIEKRSEIKKLIKNWQADWHRV
jgi:hypothetical protein